MNLKTIRQVAWKEFRGYFQSPEAYAVLIVFLVLSGLYAFMYANFIPSDDASLAGFLDGHRWIYLILIPALGMQMWTEEQRSGTLELLFTLPVREIDCIIGKFMAGIGVVAVALLFTFPSVITVCYLGSPDIGMMVSGYLGSLLLASAYIGICSLTSALSHNQVISYILGATACLCLNIFGLPALGDVLTGRYEVVAQVLSTLGVREHYQPFLRGIVDTRDLYYFLAITAFGLFGTLTVLWVRRSGGMGDMVSRIGKRLKKKPTELNPGAWRSLLLSGNGVLLFLWTLIMLGVILSTWHLRFDLTENNMYTLSKEAREILANVESPVELRYYVSRDKIARWAEMKVFAKRVEDVLSEYEVAMPEKIHVRKLDVTPDSPSHESAQVDGIHEAYLENLGQVWFGIAVGSKDKRVVLPQPTPLTEANLEYEITRAILKVTQTERMKVSVLTQLPVGGHLSPEGTGQPPWIFIRNLREYTNLRMLPLSVNDIDPLETDVLVLIQPNQLPPNTQYAIDQYLMRGGKVLLFYDPLCAYAANASQLGIPGLTTYISPDLGELLSNWGITISPTVVAADMTLARADAQTKQRFPSALDVTDPECFNTGNPVTNHIKHLLFTFSGFTHGAPPEGVTRTPLVTTSPNSDYFRIDKALDHANVRTNFKSRNSKLELASWHNGTFKSAYGARAPDGLLRPPGGHRSESEPEASLVIVGDVDLLYDTYNLTRVDNPFDPLAKMQVPCNDNIAFALNLVDALGGNAELAQLRGERHLRRPFTRLHRMRADLEQRVLNSEKELIREFYEGEANLRRLRASPSTTQAELDIHIRRLEELKAQYADFNQYRYELAAIENRLTFFNVAAMPLVILLFGCIFLPIIAYRRRAR